MLTLVSEPEALAILRVVAVEVDDCLMSCAQEGSRKFTAAVLANQCAAVLRPITHLQEVMVIFSSEVQELDVCSCMVWKQANYGTTQMAKCLFKKHPVVKNTECSQHAKLLRMGKVPVAFNLHYHLQENSHNLLLLINHLISKCKAWQNKRTWNKMLKIVLFTIFNKVSFKNTSFLYNTPK